MENRKQETGNWKLVNVPVFHLRFSVFYFPFLPVRFRLCRVMGIALTAAAQHGDTP